MRAIMFNRRAAGNRFPDRCSPLSGWVTSGMLLPYGEPVPLRSGTAVTAELEGLGSVEVYAR